ncbi:hypothetical protein GCM10023331_23310 [Algivirga pacifica]|uniref:Secretion system C-terminal sorting domain-containing protein n=2 Tax=Algivirga pacifica TaxID=1162670 RepID=A0ABP9DAJ6_9BACT
MGMGSLAFSQQFVKAEYHIDEDKGPGNGRTDGLVVEVKNDTTFTFTVDFNSLDLAYGRHLMIVRALWRSEQGEEWWSMNQTAPFYVHKKATPVIRSGEVAEIGLMINGDTSIFSGATIDTLVDGNSLPLGMNAFSVVAWDQQGDMGIPEGGRFMIKKPLPTRKEVKPLADAYFYFGEVPLYAENQDSAQVYKVKENGIWTDSAQVPYLEQEEVISAGTPAQKVTFVGEVDSAALDFPYGRHFVYGKVATAEGEQSITAYQRIDRCFEEVPVLGYTIQDTLGGILPEAATYSGLEVQLDTAGVAYALDYRYEIDSKIILSGPSGTYSFPEGGVYQLDLIGGTSCQQDTVSQMLTIDAPYVQLDTAFNLVFKETDKDFRVIWEDLNTYFGHVSGQAMTYSVKQKSNILQIDTLALKEGQFKAAAGRVGTSELYLRATDENGVVVEKTFYTRVSDVNDRPYIRKGYPPYLSYPRGKRTIYFSNIESYFGDRDDNRLKFTAFSDTSAVQLEITDSTAYRTYRDTINGEPVVIRRPYTLHNLSINIAADFLGVAFATVEASDAPNRGNNALSVQQLIQLETYIAPIPIERTAVDFPVVNLFDGDRKVIVDNLNAFFKDPSGGELEYKVRTVGNGNGVVKVYTDVLNANRLWVDVPYDFQVGGERVEITARDPADISRVVKDTLWLNIDNIDAAPRVEWTQADTLRCQGGTYSLDLKTKVNDDNSFRDEISIEAVVTSISGSYTLDSLGFQWKDSVLSFNSLPNDRINIGLEVTLEDRFGHQRTEIRTLRVLGNQIIRLNNENLSLKHESSSYQWYKDGVAIEGANSKVLENPEEGVYTVEHTSLVCTSVTAPYTIRVTSVEDGFKEETKMTLYPNPVKDGRLNLSLSGDSLGEVEVRLIHSSGQLIHNYAIRKVSSEQVVTLALKNIGKGLYFVQVILADGRVLVEKVLVN